MEPAQIKVMLEAAKDKATAEAWGHEVLSNLHKEALDYICRLENNQVGQPLILG
jgi:hypothetical protein